MDAARREQLEAQLSAYLDGELGPDEASEIEALLTDDPGVAALVDELRATIDAVRKLPRAQAPETLVDDLRAQLERESLLGPAGCAGPHSETHRPLPGRPLAAAAVIALTCLAGYLVWSLVQEESLDPSAGRAYVMREPDAAPPAEQPARTSGDPGASERAARLFAADESEGQQAQATQAGVTAAAAPLARSPVDSIADLDMPAAEQAAPAGEQPRAESLAWSVEGQEGQAVPEPAPELQAPVEPDGIAAPPADWTLLELTYADNAGRQNAVQTLQDLYAVRPFDRVYHEGQSINTELFPQPVQSDKALDTGAVEDGDRPEQLLARIGDEHVLDLTGEADSAGDAADTAPMAVLALDVPDETALADLLANVRAETNASACRVLKTTRVLTADRPAQPRPTGHFYSQPGGTTHTRSSDPTHGQTAQVAPPGAVATSRPAEELSKPRGPTADPGFRLAERHAAPPARQAPVSGMAEPGRIPLGPASTRSHSYAKVAAPATPPAPNTSNILHLYLRVNPQAMGSASTPQPSQTQADP